MSGIDRGFLPGDPEVAIELAGAILPPILGVLQILVLAILLRRLLRNYEIDPLALPGQSRRTTS